MKNVINILIVLFFVSCGTTKESMIVVDNTYYNAKWPYAQNWIGGAPGSGSGFNLYIPTNSLADPIKVQEVYFRKMKSQSVQYTDISRAMLVAKFTLPSKTMSSDSAQEYSNEPPLISKEILDLEMNQAVVVYSYNGKTKTKKIKNIQNKEPIVYPSMPQQ